MAYTLSIITSCPWESWFSSRRNAHSQQDLIEASAKALAAQRPHFPLMVTWLRTHNAAICFQLEWQVLFVRYIAAPAIKHRLWCLQSTVCFEMAEPLSNAAPNQDINRNGLLEDVVGVTSSAWCFAESIDKAEPLSNEVLKPNHLVWKWYANSVTRSSWINLYQSTWKGFAVP